MAGLVGYVLLAVFAPYAVLALLPPGWLVRVLVAIGLVAGAVGWYGWQSVATDDDVKMLGQAELTFLGLGSGLAALVRTVRMVFPAMRVFGSYGVLVLIAPFFALFAVFVAYGTHD